MRNGAVCRACFYRGNGRVGVVGLAWWEREVVTSSDGRIRGSLPNPEHFAFPRGVGRVGPPLLSLPPS
jgi:hypothetical protein